MLEPLGHQPHAVVQHEDAGGCGRPPCRIDQDDVAILQCWHHAVSDDMHDPEIGGSDFRSFLIQDFWK